jgi:hypothetical protein
MFDLIDTPPKWSMRPAPAAGRRRGHVRFEDVRFGYDPGARS